MRLDDTEVRLAVLETQMERIVSDIESEKATRARVNSEIISQLQAIDQAQRKIEKIIWTGLGGLGVLQFALGLIFRH